VGKVSLDDEGERQQHLWVKVHCPRGWREFLSAATGKWEAPSSGDNYVVRGEDRQQPREVKCCSCRWGCWRKGGGVHTNSSRREYNTFQGLSVCQVSPGVLECNIFSGGAERCHYPGVVLRKWRRRVQEHMAHGRSGHTHFSREGCQSRKGGGRSKTTGNIEQGEAFAKGRLHPLGEGTGLTFDGMNDSREWAQQCLPGCHALTLMFSAQELTKQRHSSSSWGWAMF
jgi:hypothetical protein